MKTFVRESYREIVDRLEREAPDLADRQLLDCLKAVGAPQYETLMNRAGALAAAIRRSREGGSRRDYLEAVATSCEQYLLQHALMAHGINEVELFQRVSFRLPS